ncbi:MAG: cupin [Actinobacteria bacterium]|nr:cupin [Actinomycetota bacterium]
MNDYLTSPNLGLLGPFAVEPSKVDKPWGYELIWAVTDEYVGKILFVRAGESLSLQFHNLKDESWLVHSGRARIEMAAPGEKLLQAEVIEAGAAFRIRPGIIHRVTGVDDTTIIEVSTPHLDDVVRLEDRYGRTPQS